MQSYDKNGQVVSSKVLEKYQDLEKELENTAVRHLAIGKLPHKGDTVIVNGLKFKAITGTNQIKRDKRLILELL